MNRDAYVEKLKAQLDEWNSDLNKLEARARGANADARIRIEGQLAILRQRRDEARKKLDEIRAASNDAWQELRQGAEEAWNRLREAVAKAKAQFD